LLVATLGFASFLLIYRGTNLLKSASSGLFAGLALLSHLNGTIYIVAGFVVLLYYKQYRNLFIFSIISLFVGSLYFYDIWLLDGFRTWQWQFMNDPATQSTIGIANKIRVMLTYPKLFFESPEQAVLSLLLLVLGWVCFPYFKSFNRGLVVYSLALFLSFWLLTKSATAIYQVLFIPTFFVLILELHALLVKNNQINKATYVTVGLYVCVGVVGNLQIILKNNTNYLPDQFARLSTKITVKKTGLVPLTFFFNEYRHYDKLLCQTNFELQMKQQKRRTLTKKLFFDWAKQNKVDFVVLDYLNNNADYYPDKNTLNVEPYSLTYSDGQFAIYQLK
jgi:hypothetical protein